MSNTVLTNNNEKEHENGSVTLDFGNRVVRSLSHSAANVHTSNSGILITFTNPYPLMIFCRYSNPIGANNGHLDPEQSSVVQWNSLPASIATLTDLNSFKRAVFQVCHSKP